jgi:hypothetical protein
MEMNGDNGMFAKIGKILPHCIVFTGIVLVTAACSSMPSGDETGTMSSSQAAAQAMADASVTTDAEGRKTIICESAEGCSWEVTCPDTGTFSMQALQGGDIEIGPGCEFRSLSM